MTTVTKLDQSIEKAEAYLNKVIGSPYSWWTGGTVGAPAWAKNGPPPPPANVKGTSCFCAGVTNLARRAVGLEIPTLGNPNYDGGVVAYFGSTDAAPRSFPRRGYFEVHGKQRRFDLEDARRPWTLIGRKYRNVRDQGHVAIVLPNGKVLQSYDGAGVNKDVTLERSHDGGYYEVMVRAEDWLLSDADREEPRPEKPERPEPERPERPEPERPEPERPEPAVILFTARQLSEIAQNPNLATLERYRAALVPEMQKAGITTHARVTAFLGNVMQETDRLQTLEEYGDRNYWMYLDRNSGRPGEWRYHGRGFLMNTWKDAYARLSGVLGVDLVSDPDLLTRPDLAAKAATWFWSQHNLNAYADRGEFKKVCAIINTGSEWGEPKHLSDRLYFYDRAKRILPRNLSGRDASTDGYNYDGLPYINLAAVEQADETAAFALAAEIRRVGIGVTVTNGAENVGALAETIYDEPLGYRQLWILGAPALEACGDYGDLAHWPINPKTDYYNLAGRDFSGTCRRVAELADEKVKEGVGQRFLEEMGMANHSSKKASLPAPSPSKGENEERKPVSTASPSTEYSQEQEEPPSVDGDTDGSPYPRGEGKEPEDTSETTAYAQKREARSEREKEGRRGSRNDELGELESIEGFSQARISRRSVGRSSGSSADTLNRAKSLGGSQKPVRKRRRTDASVRDFEHEEDRATAKRPWTPEPEVERPGSVDGRGLPVNDEQGRENTDGPQRSRPWGFWLVLTAIVVVTVVYSVTMLTIGREIQTPATAIGAMTAAFAVIGTLVGTYFGIKAGLDGQDKVKDTVDRAVRGAAGRPLDRDRREYE